MSNPTGGRVARTVDGGTVGFYPMRGGHTLVTGQTGSGKSVTTYGLAMIIAAVPQAQAVVIDPSGVLAAPWAAAHPASHVSGIGPDEVPRVLNLLGEVVAEMDRRTRALGRSGADKVAESWFSPRFPAIWVILEEYAGLLAVTTDRKDRERITTLVGRLLREGRKAGVSVLTILQRPEAAVLHDRGQYSRLMLHLLENGTSVGMVLDDPDPETVHMLTTLRPGEMGYKVIGPNPIIRAKSYRVEFAEYSAWIKKAAAMTPGFMESRMK